MSVFIGGLWSDLSVMFKSNILNKGRHDRLGLRLSDGMSGRFVVVINREIDVEAGVEAKIRG